MRNFQDTFETHKWSSVMVLNLHHCTFKDALSDLRRFLATEMIKNAFYFTLKALFVLKIFTILSWIFGHVEKTAWLER